MDSGLNKISPEEKFKLLLNFVKTCGISINTKTKARGHQGFFMKNRIDISTLLDVERKIEVLVHEFAHYCHYLIEPEVAKNHGSLKKLFSTENTAEIEKELTEVTKFIDRNTALTKLKDLQAKQKAQIKELDEKIKSKYPDFKRSEPFKKFEAPLKKCNAKYLLKYDKVKIMMPANRLKTYNIKEFMADFPQFDEYFDAYINLKSHQRMLRRISSRINRLNRYYSRPSELFARFCESLYANRTETEKIAPMSTKRFFELLENNYYGKLKDLFELCENETDKNSGLKRVRRFSEPFFGC